MGAAVVAAVVAAVGGTVTRLVSRVVAVFTRRHDDRELQEELDAHLALLVDEHRRRGLTEAEAHRAARLALGGATQVQEAHREARGLPFVEEYAQDIRYAVRGFRRQPGFTAIAVVTLALGIGANAAVFSLVHGVLVRPLPYQNPDALMSVARAGEGRTATRWISLRRWEAIRDARSFDVGVYRPAVEDLILGGGEPEVLRGARISANVLDILGARPILGRSFRAEEDAADGARVAIISERLWARRFGSDRSIIGNVISLGSAPHTVVGVVANDFQFPVRDADLWLPQPANAAFVAPQFHACCVPLMGVARLRPGITRERAEAELSVLNARYAAGPRQVDAGAALLMPLQEDLVGAVDTMLWILLAAVSLVLLIACANVATLLMARATSRAREFAVRTALGASRWRIIRQLVTESLVLSTTGGVLGLAVARFGVDAVATTTLFDLPRAQEVQVSGTVLVWTMAVACVTGVIFGTFPSLQLLKPAVIDRLRQSGATDAEPQRQRRIVGVSTRGALVVAQVGLSLILLIGATLMAQTIARLSRVDLGFPSMGLLTMRVPLPVTTYDTPEKRSRFFDELVRRVEAVPGVRGATVVRALPTTGGLGTNLQIDSQRIPDPGHVGLMLQTAVPGYFEVVGLGLRRGRTFEARDNIAGAPPVAIVNESFARRFWPSYPSQAIPLGERVTVPILPSGPLEIVGVVADVHHGGPARDPDPQVYIPDRLYPPQTGFLALRANGDPLRAVDAVRAQVRAIDANQSITDVRMMDDLLERSVGQQHLAARVLGLFAATAFVLALIGLYGVMAYAVAQRTQEIGVRRALGAGHRNVLWMVVGQGLRVTLIGVVCGVAGAYAGTRLLQSLLFEVSATDPVTFVGVPAALVLAAVAASLVPAWRALRIDPAAALRAQ
jgi:putative ABC transport system permease protein